MEGLHRVYNQDNAPSPLLSPGPHSSPTPATTAPNPPLPDWQYSYSLSKNEQDAAASAAAMPEPSHRMPPPGFSALNYAPPPNFGNPSYESVARICQHFEAKCGGRYASDSPAARYVFEMSREVQSQLTALKAAEEKRINSRLSSSVSSRWEDSFGPSSTLSKDLKEVNITITPADSGAVTPAAVSEAVSTLVERIRAMERALAEERGERASREGSYQEALRSHMAASGAASDADRSEYAKQQAEIAHQAQEALVTIREQRDLVMQQVIQEKDAEYSKMVEGYKKQLNDVQLELLNNRQHTLNTEAQWRRRLEDAEQRERAEVNRVKEHYEAVVAKAKESAAAGAVFNQGPGGEARLHAALSTSEATAMLHSQLEDSKKESRWLRERNSENERVIEALRKTIMRQAELSSQREAAGAANPAPGMGGNNMGGGGSSRGNFGGGRRSGGGSGNSPGGMARGQGQRQRHQQRSHHSGGGYHSHHQPSPVSNHHHPIPRHNSSSNFNVADEGSSKGWQPPVDVPPRSSSRSAPLPEMLLNHGAQSQPNLQSTGAAGQNSWDRMHQPRDTAAFMSMPYPPGLVDGQPAQGSGALFEPLRDGPPPRPFGARSGSIGSHLSTVHQERDFHWEGEIDTYIGEGVKEWLKG